jgi:hypothetical protein
MADKLEIDARTGKTVDGDFSEAEKIQRDKDLIRWAQEAKDREKAQAERAAARQAVLDKLGLTADEAAALLG